jgi:hypothetical protein
VVQWFSGMLFCVAGAAIYHSNSLISLIETGEKTQQVRGGWDRRFGLEKGIKGRKVSQD